MEKNVDIIIIHSFSEEEKQNQELQILCRICDEYINAYRADVFLLFLYLF